MHDLEPFPNADKIKFKQKFIDRYSKLTDWETFRKYCLSFLRRAIRVNTIKISVDEVKKKLEDKGWILTPVPWCKDGFFIEHQTKRRDIGNTLEHQLGYIYIQEPASMIPSLVLNPQENEIILDIAASPGSKTSHMSQLMNNTGVIISNDMYTSRIVPLSSNLSRLGVINSVITICKGQQYSRMRDYFDKVLVDAPCSGTGTIRKSPKTINMWNPNMLKPICNVQRELMSAGFRALKPGGTLIYSTCSLEPEENEGIVSWLLENFDAEVEKFELEGLNYSSPVQDFEGKQYNEQVKNTCRIWPQDNDTEGFFIAKISKRQN